MDLEQRLVDELTSNPGQKASQLANKFDAPRQEVNRLLNRLGHQFEQDSAYRWWPIDNVPNQNTEDSSAGFSKTPLARLCRYYLACLGQDDVGEISTWARSQHDYDYVALNEVPTDGINRLLQEPGPASLLSAMQRERGSKVLYLGYPICINRVTSRKGEHFYRLEPVLLLPIEFEHPNNRGTASVSSDFPLINTAVIKRYSNADDFTLMYELLQLEDELGFSNTNADVPELDEVAQRLFTVRNEWLWKEACDGSSLQEVPPIHELDESGIYNRAVLVAAERKLYTQGLEHELGELAKLEASDYEHTALGKLVNNNPVKNGNASNQESSLLEVLPMNTEQRQAIHRSLTEPLTIITGPPGTGKSQVVTNLLINAAWQKKNILFASKNNKAVDVVETRVNSLGSRPILLRMGSKDYLQRLNEHVQDLLSATAEPDQVQDYDDALAAHQKLIDRAAEINSSLERVVSLRNTVDGQEQSVEHLRSKLGDDVFQYVRKHPNTDFEGVFKRFFIVLASADKARQKRLLWPFMRKSRVLKIIKTLTALDNRLSKIGLSIPFRLDATVEFEELVDFSEQIKGRIKEIEDISDYFQLLHYFQGRETLESLNRRHRQLLIEIAENSSRLWANWLRVIPAKLSNKDRQLLSQYAAVIKMVIDTRGGRPTASIWRQYYSLKEKVSHLLPCWAVTSLSTRGRLPFS